MLLLVDLFLFSCDWFAVPLPLPLLPLALAPRFPGREAHNCHTEVSSSSAHSLLLVASAAAAAAVVVVHSPLLLGPLVVQ